jgi:multiple sugar transport system ATP-binding protein
MWNINYYRYRRMANVRLEGITRKFATVTAIADITFEVPDGEFWVLVGPSGCGKSTILRAIAGLESVTEGKLYIGDTLVNNVPARQRDVAMVFQNYALYPHMTVADNLSFGLRMRKVDKKTIEQRVEMVARSLDIAHLLDRKPKQLSGGQQQRVALGRAIAREPKVFLLDEPLSNLDTQLRDETRAELKRLHQRLGITTIYVTHDQVEAMTLADQIVVLEQGQIQQIGEPQTVYAQPKNRMVATFLGNPPMNLLRGTFKGEGFQICRQWLAAPEALRQGSGLREGQVVDLGIRPEHLELVGFAECGGAEEGNLLVLAVDVVEPLGRETLIRGKLPESESFVNVRAGASWRGCPGDLINIRCDRDRLFVFDRQTGEVLYAQQNISS